MELQNHFSVSLGLSALVTTTVVTLALIAVVLFSVLSLVPPFDLLNTAIAIAITIAVCVLYILVYLHRPLKYVMDHEKIVVIRRLKPVKIFFSEIADVFIVNKDTMSDVARIGGSAGVFGYFGEFQTGFGRTTFYVTRLDKFILVKTTADEKIVLSPDTLSMYYDLKDAINLGINKSPLRIVDENV
jgi:hypothetical protein